MKLGLASWLLVVAGCATAPPVVISARQQQAFDDVIQKAEAESAGVDEPEASRLLCQAKDEFAYGQRTPMYPDRERANLARAQRDAEQALVLVRRAHQRQAVADRLAQ